MARGHRRAATESEPDDRKSGDPDAAYPDTDSEFYGPGLKDSDLDGSELDSSELDGTDAEDAGGGPGTKMLRNSLFLMASAGLTAGIGFIFWALVAHLYSSTQIGLATTLLSAISLISFLSTFGFGATMIRFPARGAARHRQVSMMLALVAAASFVLGTGYVLAVRLISPDLAFVRDKPVYALVLIVICVFATVNLVTDSVFMAARRAEYNTLVDGFIQSVAKLAIPVFVVGMGAMGIVAASGTGYVVATLASLYFMYRKLDFRFSFRLGGTRIRETAGYSATTQFSSLLNLIPQLALPIITLRWLGPDDVTYYYLGSQIAALLSTGSYAIGDALFSEGAHDPEQLRSLMKRSATIMTAVMVPGVAAVILVREPLLSLFGSKYPGHAQGLLTILALGALAVAFHTWASSALRITGRMTALLGSNLVYLLATLALALGFAHRGLNWIGWAWALGNLASGLFAVAFVPGAKMAALDQAGEDHGSAERLEPEQDFARVAVNDSTAITEPMFFPWNRPEARGRSDRFDAYGSDDDGHAPPQLYGRESWRPVGAGGLRVRPRSVPRQARPTVPRSSSEPEPEPEPPIVRPINVPESFFRPEPEEDRDPRPERGPEPPMDDASGAGAADGPWRPPSQ
ncbi:lipopolysaccharide biosynthesis protein [Catenulispora pinisilvae]|uniref:lipopolysaccharide biosynthesis protein n=1 Tax=Catenulispora pinisilvae TaxID=2705253 RepID=UPI0018914757|nr:oligosaccharide flippase family protein [Catenulispora pinisilvae]